MNSENDNEFDFGTGGASARREHDRRAAKREQRARHRHPHIGGLLIALQGEPQHQQAWARGAGGEEQVAERLANLVNNTVILLNDRRPPGSRANIDHIALGPAGVWVVDTKRYKGKVRVERPWFGNPKLKIAGRDQTKLIDGLTNQVALVAKFVGQLDPAVPVRGVLCFVEADLPLLGTLTFDDHELLYPRALARRLNAAGSMSPAVVRELARQIASQFPAA